MPISKYDIAADVAKNPNSSHAFVLEMVGANKQVLDVGCDTGYLGEVLGTSGNRMFGFEINDSSAEVARTKYEKVVVGDLEALDLSREFAEPFDVVVFADVLEHLRDPLPVLRRAKGLLAPGGSIVISVPNVAHGDLRLNLLRGRWDYTEVGLLDDTHTRFFTRETLTRFVREAGFSLVELRRTKRPLFRTEVDVNREDFDPATVASIENDLEAVTYQFVIRIVPEDVSQISEQQVLLVDSLRADLERAERSAAAARKQAADASASAEQLREELKAVKRKNVAGASPAPVRRTRRARRFARRVAKRLAGRSRPNMQR